MSAVKPTGKPAMKGHPPVRDLSDSVRTVGGHGSATQSRDAAGRWKPREPRIVGPLNKPTGPGGYDAVVGHGPEGWIPGVRNNAQLQDFDRVTATTVSPYYQVPDFSGGPPVSAHYRNPYAGLSWADRMSH